MAAILTGERTALNFLQRLSGVATFTRRMVGLIAGSSRAWWTPARPPRAGGPLEKYAVRVGGAATTGPASTTASSSRTTTSPPWARSPRPCTRPGQNTHHLLKIEVEVTALAGLEEALAAGADVIMLDNMDEAAMTQAVQITAGRALLEASGSMSADRLPQVAATGVNLISMGALTHSAPAVDIHLRLIRILGGGG